jgi:hypothetical protein
MKVQEPNNYTFKGFQRSHLKEKKYDAILENKKTKQKKLVPFGDKKYEQYKDKALGLYKNKDHLDPKRRRLYRERHEGEDQAKYSSGYFAYKYLW